MAGEEPSRAGRQTYSLTRGGTSREFVLFRPSIHYRYRCESNSLLLAFRLQVSASKELTYDLHTSQSTLDTRNKVEWLKDRSIFGRSNTTNMNCKSNRRTIVREFLSCIRTWCVLQWPTISSKSLHQTFTIHSKSRLSRMQRTAALTLVHKQASCRHMTHLTIHIHGANRFFNVTDNKLQSRYTIITEKWWGGK